MPRSASQPTAPAAASTPKIPSTFTDNLPLPKLLVFDLDYTLWPFWVDTHVSAPLKPAASSAPNTAMLDRTGDSFKFYAEVPAILAAAHARGITMSLASRTHAPDLARDMLRGLHVASTPEALDPDGAAQQTKMSDWKVRKAIDFFAYPQIYPGTKTTHFRHIQAAARKAGQTVAFEDMVFFDDESRNRNVETELKAVFCLVEDGVNCRAVDEGVWEWRRRRGITGRENAAGAE